jgi:transcriptional regulator with XRE-family HTH domain
MSSLSNYLRTSRKLAALSQEEVAFLLGINGPNKAAKVCRDENFARDPTLQTALAYEAIYGRPIRELFAGQYQRIEQDVAACAKILAHRKNRESNQKRHQTLAKLILRHVNSPLN